MRNMAYAVTISKVTDIEGKDKIGLGHFEENAYTVIVPKTYKKGDVVCYFEVDSILPVDPRFEFLRKRCYNERCQGFLIKKMRMAGNYSYGLTLTSEELGIPLEKGKVYDEVLGVRKDEDRYDASPKQFNGKELVRVREFPTDVIPKSDEDNILNDPSRLDLIKKEDPQNVFTSIKLEGQSVTIFMEKRTIKDVYKDVVYDLDTIKTEIEHILKKIIHRREGVSLRKAISFALEKHIGKIKKIPNPFFLGKSLAVFGRNIEGNADHKKFAQRLMPLFKEHPTLVLQGEYTSPKVQRGIYKNGENFNVYRARENGKELTPTEFCKIIDNANIEGVKHVEYIDLDLNDFDLDNLQILVDGLKFKEGSSKLDPEGDKLHEGIVIRTGDMRIHFKVKNREYGL
jgi:hypothetical protein